MILLCLCGLILKLLCLFVISDLLKTIEILTRLFVKLTVDEIDDVFDPRDLDEF
jgi:hypothetical protein